MREKGVERQLNDVKSLVFCVFIPSSYALLAALILLIACQCGLREGIVEPPVDQRRHGGEAGGDELLELGAVDGQQGLAQSAQDLVDEGQSQHSGAGEGGSGNGAVGGDMCVHGMSFLPARPGGQSWMGRALARLYSSVPVPLPPIV